MSHPFDTPGVLIARASRWDRDALARRIDARADALQAQGLRPGQVVLAPDTPAPDLLLTHLALLRLGAALFPHRTGLDDPAVVDAIETTSAEWRWSPATEHLSATGRSAADSVAALALLIRTSGSMGDSKIVMLTRENLEASARASNVRLGYGREDVWLCSLRLSHIGGLAIIHRWALAGATLVLHEGFDVARVADDLHRHGVTHVSLVPPMLDRLVTAGVEPPPSLRVVLVGGQALSPTLARRALAAGWPLHPTYGMTETTSQIATAERAWTAVEPDGRVGPLLPGVEIVTQPERDGSARLRVRGPMLMAGYANPSRAPGQGLDAGWLTTSDLGGLTADGVLAISGRADDVLVIGGQNIALRSVEERLRAAPGVRDVALVALDDPVWGHRLVALYCGELDDPSLADWCARTLAGAERPRAFARLDALPLLESGKHDRMRLRHLALEALGDQLSADT